MRGRVAHESIFNVNDGQFPLPEFAAGLLAVHHVDARPGVGDVRLRRATRVPATVSDASSNRSAAAMSLAMMRKAAEATCDFYIENTPPDGIPYWDTGAPGLANLAIGGAARRSVQRSRAGGQFGGRDRGAGPAAARTLI